MGMWVLEHVFEFVFFTSLKLRLGKARPLPLENLQVGMRRM